MLEQLRGTMILQMPVRQDSWVHGQQGPLDVFHISRGLWYPRSAWMLTEQQEFCTSQSVTLEKDKDTPLYKDPFLDKVPLCPSLQGQLGGALHLP